MVIKVGINGFGRIGRVVFRACIQHSELQIAAINDPAVEVEYICYLIRFDSTHGKLNGNITHTDDEIKLNDIAIKVFHHKAPSSIPWNSVGVEYVIEASGMFTNLEKASGHLASDAVKRVIVTAPSVDVPMVIMGVNDSTLGADQKIISCGSSTLYCLAPIVKILEDNFGIEDGFITSIHAMTPSLKPLDGLCLKGKHWRDHRSIHQNIIPASTGACKALGKILPALRDKLTGLAFRVPIVNVSVLDLTIRLNKDTTLLDIVKIVEKINKSSSMHTIIKTSNEETVSSDYATDSHSCILDVKSSLQLKPNFFKLICWYENEHSYACRVIDSIVFSEKQISESKTKIANVKPKLSKNQDIVLPTRDMLQKKYIVANSKTQIQNTDMNNKLQPRSAILRKTINSRNSSGMSSPTGNNRESKKKTELFKIWHDETEKVKPSIQDNINSFFHNVNPYTLQNTNQADCIKAQQRLENVKREFSKMLIITEDLLKKSQKTKLNSRDPSTEGVAVATNLKKDNKKEPKKTYKVLEKVQDLQICSAVFDVSGDDKANNSKMFSDCSTEDTMFNSEKKDNLGQSTVKKSKVLKSINDVQNTGQKFESLQNNYNFKNNLTKTFNSLLDGITKNFQFQNLSGDRDGIKISQKEKVFYEKHENQINTKNNYRTDCKEAKSFDEITTIKTLIRNKDKEYESRKGVHIDRKLENEQNTCDVKNADIKSIVSEPKKQITSMDKNKYSEAKWNEKTSKNKGIKQWNTKMKNTCYPTTMTKERNLKEGTTAHDYNNKKTNIEKNKIDILNKWEGKIKKFDSFFILNKDTVLNKCKVIHNEDTPNEGKSNVINMLTKWEHEAKTASNSLTITHANVSKDKNETLDDGILNHEKFENKILTKRHDKIKISNRPLYVTDENVVSEKIISIDELKHSYDNGTTNRKSTWFKFNDIHNTPLLPITKENVLCMEKKISVDEDKQNNENAKNKIYFTNDNTKTDTDNESTISKQNISDKSKIVHKEKLNDKPMFNENIKWEDTTNNANHDILISKQMVINNIEKMSVTDMKQNDALSKTRILANTINNTNIITPKITNVIITKTDNIADSKETLDPKNINSPKYENNHTSTIIPTKAYNYEINLEEDLEKKSKNNEGNLDLTKANIKYEILPKIDFRKAQNVTCDKNTNAEAEKIENYNYNNRMKNNSNRNFNYTDTSTFHEEVKKRVIIIVDDHRDVANDSASTRTKKVYETEKLRVETYNRSINDMDLRKLVSDNFNEFNSKPIVIMTENTTNKLIPQIDEAILSNEKRIYIEDIYDKLDSASDTDSENSMKIDARKSQIIRITDLTSSLEDLERLDKICRIIEISDDLSEKLFSPLDNTATASHTTNKNWSFKDLCKKINLDEFCHHVFSGQSTDKPVMEF